MLILMGECAFNVSETLSNISINIFLCKSLGYINSMKLHQDSDIKVIKLSVSLCFFIEYAVRKMKRFFVIFFVIIYRIGNDRFKSKVIYETLCPRWLEQFDLNLSEDQLQELEVTVWDKDQGRKDDFMGRYRNIKL